jgi:hypothetical protein
MSEGVCWSRRAYEVQPGKGVGAPSDGEGPVLATAELTKVA